MTYDGALNATTAAVGDFVVQIDGAANAVTAVSVSGSTVELTLTTTVANGDTVTVAYTDPSVGDEANAIQDTAGNDAITITAQAVTNNVPLPDTSIVVFDLVNGVSSDHSSRTFDQDESYTIYLVVDANSHVLNINPTTGNATWGRWDGGVNLGDDDKMVLVSGDGEVVLGGGGLEVVVSSLDSKDIVWGSAVSFTYPNYNVKRLYDGEVRQTTLFRGWGGTPITLLYGYGPLIPGGVLTTQGLV
jgi:hypothetical protein